MKKSYLSLLAVGLSLVAQAQLKIKLVDAKAKPLANATLRYQQQDYRSNAQGYVEIPVADQPMNLEISQDKCLTKTVLIFPEPKMQELNIGLENDPEKVSYIQEIVFQNKNKKPTDISMVSLSGDKAKAVASITGGIEDLLKTLPYVNSNTELSSQYMVRGGNYDENLIYINNVEIYRPFLVGNSQQEGMSIINPDMVANVNFSAGGFEARYGDKMSSVLNVIYRKPQKTEVSGELSTIGGRLTLGLANKAQTFSMLTSARYRNIALVLKQESLNAQMLPVYQDVQTSINYDISPQLNLSVVALASQNSFTTTPVSQNLTVGPLDNPINITSYFDGQEKDAYTNLMASANLTYKPSKTWRYILDVYGARNQEKEHFDIDSDTVVKKVNTSTEARNFDLDYTSRSHHARNNLDVKIIGAQVKVRHQIDPNTDAEIGLKYDRESIQDLTSEWQVVRFNELRLPILAAPVGSLNTDPLQLNYSINGRNNLQANRLATYAQMSHKFLWDEHKIYVNAGLRHQYWDFNHEHLLSPRLQISLKPNWESDMLFKLSGGVYYQAPFYKEIINLSGQFNTDIKAQKSYQIILANDYEFRMFDRPFKLNTEAYYKHLSNLIPYYLENVRLKYTSQNNSQGQAYGLDARLNGEIIKGSESWVSLSYARALENINNQGQLPRPTDQRLRFSLFYQDVMPKFTSMKINLMGVFAMGLPNGAPLFSDPYQFRSTLPAYKRVDMGLTKIFVDQYAHKARPGSFLANFTELSLGLNVFNVFNMNNAVANQWVADLPNNSIYAVPVRLTGRYFNLKLDFKF
jgi:TonB-dependent Receptor Plug Domain